MLNKLLLLPINRHLKGVKVYNGRSLFFEEEDNP